MAKGASKTFSYRVFVSHGWDDRWVAKQMAHTARDDAKASVIIDVFDVRTGDRIAEKVKEGLVQCDELVALLTPRSAGRSWVWAEIGGVWAAGKRVVGVLYGLTLDEIRANYGGAACLEGVSCIALNDFDSYVEELSERVKSSFGGRK